MIYTSHDAKRYSFMRNTISELCEYIFSIFWCASQGSHSEVRTIVLILPDIGIINSNPFFEKDNYKIISTIKYVQMFFMNKSKK